MNMMLFKPEHIEMIVAGTKTETRRMWKDLPRCHVESVHQVKRLIFTKDHFGYIFIWRIQRDHLNDITEEGAKKEGGYTREEYLNLFHRIYPKAGDNPEVWVVSFKYIGLSKPLNGFDAAVRAGLVERNPVDEFEYRKILALNRRG